MQVRELTPEQQELSNKFDAIIGEATRAGTLQMPLLLQMLHDYVVFQQPVSLDELWHTARGM